MKNRLLIETKEFFEFKYCPKCGKPNVIIVSPGDYLTSIYCLMCDFELDDLLNYDQFKSRYPDSNIK